MKCNVCTKPCKYKDDYCCEHCIHSNKPLERVCMNCIEGTCRFKEKGATENDTRTK